jgi:hypothetical protein
MCAVHTCWRSGAEFAANTASWPQTVKATHRLLLANGVALLHNVSCLIAEAPQAARLAHLLGAAHQGATAHAEGCSFGVLGVLPARGSVAQDKQ